MAIKNAKKLNQISAQRIDGDILIETEEILAIEHPLQININDQPFSITMRTPGADEYLVKGLIHTESLLTEDDVNIEFSSEKEEETGFTKIINAAIPESNIARDIQGQRALSATSSCGLCGKVKLEDIESIGCPLTIQSNDQKFEIKNLPDMMDIMRQKQNDFEASGGTHAAALFSMEGKFLKLFEDVGRHNAVDKVIGWTLFENKIEDSKVLIVSGRLSYEIISKAWRGKIPVIAAVSAPSSLAVYAANRLGITLLGFCRGKRATIYSHPQRILHAGNEINK